MAYNFAPTRNDKAWLEAVAKANPPRIEGGKFYTGLVRFDYPVITRERVKQEMARPGSFTKKYGINALFPSDNVDMALQYLRAAARKFYPDLGPAADGLITLTDKNGGIRPQLLRINPKDHPQGQNFSKPTPRGYAPGFYYIAPKSGFGEPGTIQDHPPAVYYIVNNQWVPVPAPEIDRVVYGGAWGWLRCNAIKSTTSKPGVTFGFDTIWKFADDERLMTGSAPAAASEGGVIDPALVQKIEDPNAIMKSNPAPGDGWDSTESADSGWGE